MTEKDRIRFEKICHEAARIGEGGFDRDGIGMLSEKRLHRVLKRFFSEEASAYEVPVGRFVADVVTGDTLTEIQTGGLYPLRDKLKYYLEETPYRVSLVAPLVVRRRIVRVDPLTGEVLHSRLSPKRGRECDLLPELFWIGEHLENPRLRILIVGITLDEYRYSERLERGRKAGRYERELFPRELIFLRTIERAEDCRALAGELPDSFYAKDFERATGLHGRKASRALHFLCDLSLLRREQGQGRAYRYFWSSPSSKCATNQK